MTYYGFTAQRGMEMRYIERDTHEAAEIAKFKMERKGWNCTSVT